LERQLEKGVKALVGMKTISEDAIERAKVRQEVRRHLRGTHQTP
jgi:hypothetical protein